MFRKIVTELTYSPALAGEVSSYIKRLRSEMTTRQIGLIFVSLAITVQLFAAVFPPESANANNPSSLLGGEVKSIDDFIAYYDQNVDGIHDLFTALEITRTNLENTTLVRLTPEPSYLLWSGSSKTHQGDAAYTYFSENKSHKTAYYRPLDNSKSFLAYIGTSSSGSWFAVLKDSGSLITKEPAPAQCDDSPKATIFMPLSTSQCVDHLSPAISAQNISAGTPATAEAVNASDRIIYTLSVRNTGNRLITPPIGIHIDDVLEYATLLTTGGGTLNQADGTLVWPASALLPGETATRTFIVRVLDPLPASPQGQYLLSSYDCQMDVTFGSTIHIPVSCPLPKVIEQTVNSLPTFTARQNIVAAVCLVLITVYFYIRSRQQLVELRTIQHNQTGSL